MASEADIHKVLAFDGSAEAYSALKSYLSGLDLKAGRAPAGMSKAYQDAKFLERQLGMFKTFYREDPTIASSLTGNIKATVKAMGEDSLWALASKSAQKGASTLALENATYLNESILGEKSFSSYAGEIDEILGSLTGFHEDALGGLRVIFVKKEQSKSAAKYKGDIDAVLIRPDKVAKGTAYGSFPYVVIHELGHRYLAKHDVNFNYSSSEWITTDYSKVDSWSDEEKFAELFALSHFNYEYPPFDGYAEKIRKFVSLMNGQ